MSDSLSIAVIQRAIHADAKTNQQAFEADVRDAAEKGASLIVLPELHASPYFPLTADTANFSYAEPLEGPTTTWLKTLSLETNTVIVGSIFERRAKGVYHNTAVVLDRGEFAGFYRKMHIPDDPGFYEKFYFTPGDTGFKPIETSVGKLGVLVCWDQWFPEAARLMSLAGADVLIYPTAIGFDPNDDEAEKSRQLNAWQIVQRAHAVANGIPVISCNRVGHEADPTGVLSGTDFWGHSFVAGPQGEFLVEAKSEPANLHTSLDLSRTETVRQIWPFFRDRRIDQYQALQRYQND